MIPNERPTPLTKKIMAVARKAASAATTWSDTVVALEIVENGVTDLERSLAERTEEMDKLIEMRSYCMGILREAGHDEAAPIEALVRRSIAYASRMESERNTALAKLDNLECSILDLSHPNIAMLLNDKRDALAKLATINHIAMSLFVRATSSEVTGEMAEIGRLSREDGQ